MALNLIIWNVQHGSAAYIQTPNGKRIIIDLGAGDTARNAFSPLQHLWNAGIPTIDHATITHPHLDHIDDILNLDAFSPGTLSIPSHLGEQDIRDGNQSLSSGAERKISKYLELQNQYTGPVTPQNSVLNPENNGGVTIRTFKPCLSAKSNLNNHSVVTALEYRGLKILVPGDNEPPSWEELLNSQDFQRAIAGTNVLVAPHHGRESGYHGPLFDHFQPEITLISDGRAVDTSATSRYSAKTKGWKVHRRNGPSQVRKCVTTRNDGHIEVTVDQNSQGQPTLGVLID